MNCYRLDSTYCVLEYVYRDAGNWKTYGKCLLEGKFATDLNAEISTLLGGDGLFVPEQLGLPPLQDEHVDRYGTLPGVDHAFHEFVALRAATRTDLDLHLTQATVLQFMEALRATDQYWNCALSPYV